MQRRAFLVAGAAATAAGLAGCRSMFETRPARAPPLVDDRPDAVYYPTHVEGMKMVGTSEAGDYGVALTYSFPHRFWLVNGHRTNKVELEGSDTVHLMTTVWDSESGTVVPGSSVSATIEKNGETVVEKSLWQMLSQNMGVHAGDNLQLDGDGTYDVTVDIGPVSARRTGAFADRLDEGGSASFSFEFTQSTLEEIEFERLPDKQGDPGAVEPMEMEMLPVAQLPEAEAMPGTLLGSGESGDARFVALRLSSPPSGVEADGAYLAISLRTPYNRYPLSQMSVSGAVSRAGNTAFDAALTPTFDADLGYHYGAAVDVQSGDDLTLSVDAPPQVSRHEGYETGFLRSEDVSIDA